MKILHTADWHIGKKLHKYDLSEDFDLFIHWLISFIKEQKIDVLLVSGDIFDLANPSSEARRQFYSTLVKLHQLQCRIILTGGNHDSPAVLNAPKEILEHLQISVIGSLPENISECIFALPNETNPEIIVAAIPFLRDSELRRISDGISYEDRLQAIQDSMERIFSEASAFCAEKYPNIPAIAMGHLFATGEISTSDSEREIQVGNEARFDTQRLRGFQYIALGHIHKPQRVHSSVPTFYSGSPIPLSFSERKDQKRVLLLDTQKGFEPQSIPIPSFRKLIKIEGNLSEITIKLNSLTEISPLVNLVEIQLIEPVYSVKIEEEFNQLIHNFDVKNYEIVKTRMQFSDRLQGSSQLFEEHISLTELRPQEVFSKLLETENLEELQKQQLMQAFKELQDSLNDFS
ncbi:MAG: exonuclease SbcCD subunit D C-terminal domain-containing protein [Capnocytophaga sp.]|nr:exonuclease SbcCD subunit D C-terminal domain-containing protein [Capnocytophaga sp.]